MQKSSKMLYRYLGNSGLKVSVLSLGNWINTKQDYDSFSLAFKNGINYFDTAEIYGFGEAEKSLGEAFKKLGARREELVISTKIFKSGNGINDSFLSRKHIVEGLNNSLKRLQLEYVDVLFCHRPDMNTPMEETCRAMDWAINQGKAFYWGTSEWSASQIGEAFTICERLGLIKPIVEQCQYNLMVREKMENEYVHLFKTTKMGTTVWSPLFSGILSGKYINQVPSGSRFDLFAENARVHYSTYINNKQDWDQKLLKLKILAEKLGFTLPQLAVAWVIKNPDVSTCILGVSSSQQLVENIKALDLISLITNQIESEIEAILGNIPIGEMDWQTFTRQPNRRQILFGNK
jgi:voltage-dependent potassium channel beta subunit